MTEDLGAQPEPSREEQAPLTTPSPLDPKTIESWAAYSKDRFEYVSKRVDEFRNWARQLTGIVGVVIGLEVTLIGRVIEIKPPFDPFLRGWTLISLLLTVVLQIIPLLWALRIGYRGLGVVGPESPTVLAAFVATKDETTTNQIMGAYYARSYDEFHVLSEKVGKAVGQATTVFAGTIVLLVITIILFVRLSWTTAYTGHAMESPKSPPSASPAPAPQATQLSEPQAKAIPQASPSSTAPVPSPSSLLTTPTPGQRHTASREPTKSSFPDRTTPKK